MKKILFVIPNLLSGGAEKSLINLLDEFDYSEYKVDLLMISKQGSLFKLLNKNVNVLDERLNYISETSSLYKIKWLIANLKIGTLIKLILYKFACFIGIISEGRNLEQINWKIIRKVVNPIYKEYDVAIGYLEGVSNYIVIDKIRAKKKILWMHTDYINSTLNRKYDEEYFNKAYKIVAVSEKCKKSLAHEFPRLEAKIEIIKNIISKKSVFDQSQAIIKDKIFNNSEFKIVTIARPCESKGIDIAIDTCRVLKEKGFKFCWYYIGRVSTEEKEYIYKICKDKGIEGRLVLLGEKINPYNYLNKADIYVHPSRLEGHSMAIEEAKILCKPIVLTNFATAKNHIINEKNGYIVDLNANQLAEKIIYISKNKEKISNIVNSLRMINNKNTDEILKLYDIINE